MTTATLPLTDFLLARIAEDEAALRAPHWDGDPEWWMPEYLSRARLLAECEAKRRIVTELAEAIADDEAMHEAVSGTADAGMRVLDHLATVYVDHPDYRDEWRCRP